ncbi:hypothetical protein LAV44_11175 [Clostridium sporogenes]|uniref:hypothetical protein n=1 Tax=Clostridium sporogenes TaxID=1509 RepID=UPI002237986E|nr:hypothetical protein [Clostridium sporogenes]MCW6075867.1 hypothetical protein [Clostridium sporogenes]
MLQDMTKELKMAIETNEKLMLQNYSMKNGAYFRFNIKKRINENNNKDYIIINNKKGKENEVVKNIDLHNWFKEMDYYSCILNDDTNKAIDLPAKKIHSTNYLTIFIKKAMLPEFGGKDSLTLEKLRERIENYYEKLKKSEEKLIEIYTKSNYNKTKPKKDYKEKFLKEYFKEEIEYIRSEERINNIQLYKDYVLNNLEEILLFIKNFNEKNLFDNYVKIFFIADEDENKNREIYKKENNIYVTPRIFNVNDFNLFINGEIFGLPSSNITTNSKKPYLILKSMKCTVPSRVTAENVKVTQALFKWLEKKGKFKELKIDNNYKFEGGEIFNESETEAYFSVHLNGDTEIDGFDYIPFKEPKLKFQVMNPLNIKVYIDPKDKESGMITQEAYEIDDSFRLKKLVCELLFNNKIRSERYFKDYNPDVITNEFTGNMKALFIQGRDAMHDYFSNGIDISFKKLINKLSLDLIDEQIRHIVKGTNLSKAAKAYNLRISFLKHFEIEEGDKMADRIKDTVENLKIKLERDGLVVCESDEEFYFTAGQLAYYILSQSQSQDKSFGIFEHILNARNSKQLKRRLEESFILYKHALSYGNMKLKNALSMIMGYETKAKIEGEMKDMLLAGLLANNIFYVKKDEKNKNEKKEDFNKDDKKEEVNKNEK